MTLKIRLLGSPRFSHDNQRLNLSRRKSIALLSYLVITRQPQSREALTALLWPDLDDATARQNLRRDLSWVRQQLPNEVLLADRLRVEFNTATAVQVDAHQFEAVLAVAQSHNHPLDSLCAPCAQSLIEVIELVEGEFMAGFSLPNCEAFDEWLFFQREQWRRKTAVVLQHLIGWCSEQRMYEAGIGYGRHWLSLDPWHEPAHRALMQLYTWSDQQGAALRQYEECVRLLDEELGIEPEAETTAFFEAIRGRTYLPPQGKLTVSPVSIVRSQTSLNLPPQSTPFIGRQTELVDIQRLLLDEPDCRLLTLVGPGGMGKTRLALMVATQTSHAFEHGVHFISLAPVSAVAFIVPAIAEALKFNFQGETIPKAQLLNHLAQKNMLLIIDNFEHLLTVVEPALEEASRGEDFLSEILHAAPSLKLLVTSRERLNLQEEWSYDVSGMSLPPANSGAESDLQELGQYSAIQLFLQRARQAEARFTCSAEQMVSVVHICRLVGGMPLGIELAAPWVRLMSCQEIGDEIERSFDLLATSLRNVPERHRSMRVILEQTWQQLPSEEQVILSQLSVFRGGCLREAAEVVAGASLFQLSSLVDKALLHRTASGRYELHELIRQFSQEQLYRSPKLYHQTLERHYRYYTTFLENQVEGLKGGPQLETLKLIAGEIDNVRVACRRAIELRDISAVTQAAECLFLYSEMRGEFVEAEATFKQAVANFSEVINQAIDRITEETYHNQIGFLLVLHGTMATHTNSLNGLELTKQGVELVQKYTHDQGRQSHYREAFCCMWLGWTSFLMGFYNDARQYLSKSATIFWDLNEQWGIAKSLYMISNAYIAQGQFIEAESALNQSLTICRDIQDARSRIMVNRTLGIVTMLFGDMLLTRQLLEEAVLLSQEFNDLYGLLSTLRELGKLETAQGDLRQAAQSLNHSIALCYEIGAHWEGELAYCDLGHLLCVQGDYEAAEQTLQRALDAAITTKNPWWLPRCKAELGCLAGYREDYTLARQLLSEALDLWEQMNHEPFYAWGLAQLGHIATAQNVKRPTEAGRLYKRGLELAVKHRQAPVALNIFAGLTRLLIRAGERQKAIDLLALTMHHPACTFDTREMARKNLDNLNSDLSLETVVEHRWATGWQATAEEYIDVLAKPNWG